MIHMYIWMHRLSFFGRNYWVCTAYPCIRLAPPLQLGIDAAAGEQATWGTADLESLAVVEVDPPNWLAGLEEEARASTASENGVAPCAKCSGGGSRRAPL
jgi:hypothetical protein